MDNSEQENANSITVKSKAHKFSPTNKEVWERWGRYLLSLILRGFMGHHYWKISIQSWNI